MENMNSKIGTIMGVEPTKIGDYLVDNRIIRSECNGKSEFTGILCDVRFNKQDSINAESKLLGLDKPLSRNIVPPELKKLDEEVKTSEINEGEMLVESVSTRSKRANNVLSGVTIDRFEYLHHNPQSQDLFKEEVRGGMHTRMYEKDCKVNECGELMRLKPSSYGNFCKM